MAKTILVCGYGPGISSAVARRFGREGYAVALVGRTAERLSSGALALAESGAVAKAFPCDLSDPDAVRKLVAGARATLGPIGVVHWNTEVAHYPHFNVDRLVARILVCLGRLYAQTRNHVRPGWPGPADG